MPLTQGVSATHNVDFNAFQYVAGPKSEELLTWALTAVAYVQELAFNGTGCRFLWPMHHLGRQSKTNPVKTGINTYIPQKKPP